ISAPSRRRSRRPSAASGVAVEVQPAGANRAERRIPPDLKLEPVRQHLDREGPPLPLPVGQRTGQGQAAIRRPPVPRAARGSDWFALYREEVSGATVRKS